MLLNNIVAYKRKKVEEEKKIVSFDILIDQIELCDNTKDFKESIKGNKDISIIAEIKKASPSKGVIKENFDPISIAKTYSKNKVEAISVLTEDKFFKGKKEYLSDIKKQISIPILRKDFIIDIYQIYQSKALGADAILLIAGILSKKELIDFQRIAKELGLMCLVEVHNKYELENVLDTEAEIIGINNRDLKTFKTKLETTEKLMKYIPKDKIIISESGINTREDMTFLESLGVDGVLIGESLMRAKSIDEKLRTLRGEVS
ncbi:indole-3-glycerol phosphate synthase TrpC [Crassaminicella thermophila]|uniref:Indole-3-glycerol phosphate synthase n=1 Tax=Crassaminicella thermophila TaxID=2599308 RepID=A0A5C0SCF8_CRATE|nr:indole-3-glycerol phosphate synthase TrpC [Crassaminicella thermophila]QEK11760.1 indole-3-glycerol phosphate synthase TrpC [Crassaminicella thermophila]